MIAPQKPGRRRSPEEISRIITQLEQSSLSARPFATSHGLSYSSLTAWVRKRRQGKNSKANSAQWLELKPTALHSNPEYEKGL